MADTRTRKKAEKYPLWYQYNAMVKLLQGFGRSIRNENDYAVTYVLDESAFVLLHKMKKFVPKAYWDSLGWE
jgi:Rad3-related DNA helicase